MIIWISLSCSMILMNKALLSTWKFSFPLFLTCWHQLLASFITHTMYRLPCTTSFLPSVAETRVTRTLLFSKIAPISILFALSLACGNLAYVHLSVSFIQMLKSFSPVAVLAVSYFLGIERPCIVQVILLSALSFGVALTALGEIRFSLEGFFYQVCGLFAEAGRLVLADKLLRDLKLDSLSTIYFVAPLSGT